MDFKITTKGDLILEDGNLTQASDMDEVVQISMCIIASVAHDWYYDNVGCDLEQLLGKPMNNENISEGESIIYTNLYKTHMFEDDELFVKTYVLDDEFVGYNVYISDRNKKYNYFVIEVEIDLIKGIDVKLKGKVEQTCLY